MNAGQISRALVETKGFQPVEATELPERTLIQRDRYVFVGVREYWGSTIACGVLSIRGDDDAEVETRSEEFYKFSSSLRSYASTVGGNKLGGFGLLLVVADGPTSPRFQRVVADQKRGSGWGTNYCLVWLLDRAQRKVFSHRWFPLQMYPSRRFFRDLLESEDRSE